MNYESEAKSVRNDLRREGTVCTLEKPIGASVYNPATNMQEQSWASSTGYCLQTNYSSQLIDKTVIQAGDVRLLCSLDVEPEDGKDRIIVGHGDSAKTYRVINHSTLSPDGQVAILFIVQGRK